jgi:hypothetical protein
VTSCAPDLAAVERGGMWLGRGGGGWEHRPPEVLGGGDEQTRSHPYEHTPVKGKTQEINSFM